MKKIMSRSIVDKWLSKAISQQYSITVHPIGTCFPEKFIRTIADEGWDYNLLDEKLIIRSNDPLKIANFSIHLKSKGYFIQEE